MLIDGMLLEEDRKRLRHLSDDLGRRVSKLWFAFGYRVNGGEVEKLIGEMEYLLEDCREEFEAIKGKVHEAGV